MSSFSGRVIHALRHDNEANGVTACKIIIDLLRSFRSLTEELVAEYMKILQDVFRNMRGLVLETLCEDSPVLDPNVVVPSIRSSKVLAEMGMVAVTVSQSHCSLCPSQKVREDYEAMGSYWSGMAPTMKNPQAYMDFITGQIKMVFYVAYDMLILAALRLMQNLPSNGIQAQKDLIVVLRHLIGTQHRKALLPQIDKLFDEHILLGDGVDSKETLRPSVYASVADLVHHV
ncbi:hypothetical protein BDR07DRAFT_1490640 [Suillus spraguei]|nr:hypothetical protein BDR07DRAFT_1490640 [Suillus spraguei]